MACLSLTILDSTCQQAHKDTHTCVYIYYNFLSHIEIAILAIFFCLLCFECAKCGRIHNLCGVSATCFAFTIRVRVLNEYPVCMRANHTRYSWMVVPLSRFQNCAVIELLHEFFLHMSLECQAVIEASWSSCCSSLSISIIANSLHHLLFFFCYFYIFLWALFLN